MERKRVLKIFTAEDLLLAKKDGKTWVARGNKVYDVTEFVADHPGGDDLITQFAGQVIDGKMEDKDSHEHSASAYAVLDEYLVGRLASDAGLTVSDDWVAEDDFHPDDTNVDDDYLQSSFLDLRKPLIRQVWESNWSKSFYLQQVHQPRHLAHSARLFGPEYLEIFTKTKWYVVPLVWLPISFYLLLRSGLQFSASSTDPMGQRTPLKYLLPVVISPLAPAQSVTNLAYSIPTMGDLKSVSANAWALTFASFLVGNVVWTLLEYGFHRFLFHVDRLLPDRPAFLLLHFLTHGVHHYLPMDRLRLVMPPVLFFVLSFPMTRLAYLLFPVHMANGIISGSFAFYVLYDCMHYALHHTKLPEYMREMKKYHLAHHYKNFDLGFGVTSKVWDYVFGTVLPV
ncbi:related to fatty acid hydroxylase [Serendipita indica DSM 11827]|uniref:Ceramide very long chain fatty acid hydroxylase n=1 Tax=Serendipita indica (strain DSM 11827) TaxID=1109443 RepID=G4TKJ5_SERID|nr:related to fatty acid hydroxylase [Serendipita indica DSM 11827]